MKFFLISDNHDTQTGMRLCGIEGVIAHEPAEFNAALEDALAREDIGILLITSPLFAAYRDRVTELRRTLHRPLIVEVPDRHTQMPPDEISRYVQEAIGIKIG